MNFTSLLLKWRVYLLVLSLLSSSFIHSSPTSTDSSSSTFIYQNDLCFINAISSHHYHLILGYLYSIQLLYPCIHMYIYDLGLNTQQRAFLNSLPYLTLLKFTNNGHPYYHNGVILFKPAMILNFIDLYASLHRCRYFFYSHSNAILHKKFDISVWNELLSTGLVVERELKEYQYQVTSPQMYSYFNLSYHHDRQSVLPIRQIYSGLILIETTNSTLYENIWKKWADCIFNPLCINIPTNTTSSSPETTYTLSAAQFEQPSTSSSRSSSHSQPSHKHNINSHHHPHHHHTVNTTNRHASHIYEQSAFTFLLYKYFGYGKLSKQRVTLNNYVSIPRQHAHTTTSTSPPSNSNTSHSSSGSGSGSGSSQTMRNIIHRNQTEVKELSQQQQCNVTSQKIILCSTCFV